MNMSDKDFDQLFQSKLADMEMEPSLSVWNNMTDELDGKKGNKKAALPFMQIAAGIIVLMGVSLFFLRPDTGKISLHADAAIITNKTDDVKADESVSVPYDMADTTKPVIAEADRTAEHEQRRVGSKVTEEPVVPLVDSIQSVATLAAATTSNVNTQPDADASRQSNTIADVNPSAQSRNVAPLRQANTLASTNTVVPKNTEPVKRRKIHSLGDILNVVIAKVDKREDKIIEFTNDNDDESFNITGVNLGLFKAKKEK